MLRPKASGGISRRAARRCSPGGRCVQAPGESVVSRPPRPTTLGLHAEPAGHPGASPLIAIRPRPPVAPRRLRALTRDLSVARPMLDRATSLKFPASARCGADLGSPFAVRAAIRSPRLVVERDPFAVRARPSVSPLLLPELTSMRPRFPRSVVARALLAILARRTRVRRRMSSPSTTSPSPRTRPGTARIPTARSSTARSAPRLSAASPAEASHSPTTSRTPSGAGTASPTRIGPTRRPPASRTSSAPSPARAATPSPTTTTPSPSAITT